MTRVAVAGTWRPEPQKLRWTSKKPDTSPHAGLGRACMRMTSRGGKKRGGMVEVPSFMSPSQPKWLFLSITRNFSTPTTLAGNKEIENLSKRELFSRRGMIWRSRLL